jgi:hypothetical protein
MCIDLRIILSVMTDTGFSGVESGIRIFTFFLLRRTAILRKRKIFPASHHSQL